MINDPAFEAMLDRYREKRKALGLEFNIALDAMRFAWDEALAKHRCSPDECTCDEMANAAEDVAFGHYFDGRREALRQQGEWSAGDQEQPG